MIGRLTCQGQSPRGHNVALISSGSRPQVNSAEDTNMASFLSIVLVYFLVCFIIVPSARQLRPSSCSLKPVRQEQTNEPTDASHI